MDYSRRPPHISPRRQYLGAGNYSLDDAGGLDQAWGVGGAPAPLGPASDYRDGYPLHQPQQSTILERPSRTPSPNAARRRQRAMSTLVPPTGPSQSWGGAVSNQPAPPPPQGIMKQPQQQRRGGGRRLPATPTKPSTLNIDALSAAEAAGAAGGLMTTMSETMSINFPKLEPSPTRAKAILQGIRKVSGARLPLPEMTSTIRRSLPIRQAAGTRWSRSLDDPVTFEEAVIAGRGTRQLPAVGPQQLLHHHGGHGHGGGLHHHGGPPAGRGRGSILRRELPRPGTTIGIATNQGQSTNGIVHQPRYSESEDEEDWC